MAPSAWVVGSSSCGEGRVLSDVQVEIHSECLGRESDLMCSRKAEMKRPESETMPRVMGRDLPISAPSRSIWTICDAFGMMAPERPPRRKPVRAPRRMTRSGAGCFDTNSPASRLAGPHLKSDDCGSEGTNFCDAKTGVEVASAS